MVKLAEESLARGWMSRGRFLQTDLWACQRFSSSFLVLGRTCLCTKWQNWRGGVSIAIHCSINPPASRHEHRAESRSKLTTLKLASKCLWRSSFNFIIFADYTNAFLSDKSLETLYTRAGNELESLSEWFKANKLSLNLSKTNYIIFRSKKKILPVLDSSIKIDNKEITQVTTTKFLGVYVDEHLTFNDHVSIIAKKVAKNIGIISRIRDRKSVV